MLPPKRKWNLSATTHTKDPRPSLATFGTRTCATKQGVLNNIYRGLVEIGPIRRILAIQVILCAAMQRLNGMVFSSSGIFHQPTRLGRRFGSPAELHLSRLPSWHTISQVRVGPG